VHSLRNVNGSNIAKYRYLHSVMCSRRFPSNLVAHCNRIVRRTGCFRSSGDGANNWRINFTGHGVHY
jgi:hypothetical protein